MRIYRSYYTPGEEWRYDFEDNSLFVQSVSYNGSAYMIEKQEPGRYIKKEIIPSNKIKVKQLLLMNLIRDNDFPGILDVDLSILI